MHVRASSFRRARRIAILVTFAPPRRVTGGVSCCRGRRIGLRHFCHAVRRFYVHLAQSAVIGIPATCRAAGQKTPGSNELPGSGSLLTAAWRMGRASRAKTSTPFSRACRRTKGPATASITYHSVEMYWVSWNSSMPSFPPSRPRPDCLTPPKGAAGSDTRPRFSPIMPNSSRSAIPMPRRMSFV